ncbi:3'(2'),5'-bisphosphate nucleotidase CysQ [Xanthobacteraceae bacterium Astr-EGSB]|uniref:3'(2'),5'-bisphosphate nucleotidase CysQ family protein n=1 Tax=Astrobacterium formosum TaxID=3069710 RepID=UPI0027B78198|nr:3'(2'),5'-bisphosphate nucleotidase CysQ [Xanthobacteraceae bacterium Astr-EGSB]
MRASTSAVFVGPELSDALTRLVTQAGAAARATTRVEVTLKADSSPVTSADFAADAVLRDGLARLLPGLAVVSEERAPLPSWPCPGNFVLVDPLDGTKEFIAGRAEYAVNLAILVDRRPVAGFIALPALGLVYRGIVGRGAERLMTSGDDLAPVATPIRARPTPAEGLVAVASLSHRDAATDAFLARPIIAERHHLGSALKFCRIAEGEADVYPRLVPTREWDVAAGDALVVAAGGRVTGADGEPLRYGKVETGFVVPDFIVWGAPAEP